MSERKWRDELMADDRELMGICSEHVATRCASDVEHLVVNISRIVDAALAAQDAEIERLKVRVAGLERECEYGIEQGEDEHLGHFEGAE